MTPSPGTDVRHSWELLADDAPVGLPEMAGRVGPTLVVGVSAPTEPTDPAPVVKCRSGSRSNTSSPLSPAPDEPAIIQAPESTTPGARHGNGGDGRARPVWVLSVCSLPFMPVPLVLVPIPMAVEIDHIPVCLDAALLLFADPSAPKNGTLGGTDAGTFAGTMTLDFAAFAAAFTASCAAREGCAGPHPPGPGYAVNFGIGTPLPPSAPLVLAPTPVLAEGGMGASA